MSEIGPTLLTLLREHTILILMGFFVLFGLADGYFFPKKGKITAYGEKKSVIGILIGIALAPFWLLAILPGRFLAMLLGRIYVFLFGENSRPVLLIYLAIFGAVLQVYAIGVSNFSYDLLQILGAFALLILIVLTARSLLYFGEYLARPRPFFTEYEKYYSTPLKNAGSPDMDYGQGVVRLHSTKMKALGVKRNDLLILQTSDGKTLYRIVRGAAESVMVPVGNGGEKERRFRENDFSLENDDWRTIRENTKQRDFSLKIAPAPPWRWLHFLWNHTNIVTQIEFRLSMWIAVWTFFLGAVWVFDWPQ